jgi:hypothetical protein
VTRDELIAELRAAARTDDKEPAAKALAFFLDDAKISPHIVPAFVPLRKKRGRPPLVRGEFGETATERMWADALNFYSQRKTAGSNDSVQDTMENFGFAEAKRARLERICCDHKEPNIRRLAKMIATDKGF